MLSDSNSHLEFSSNIDRRLSSENSVNLDSVASAAHSSPLTLRGNHPFSANSLQRLSAPWPGYLLFTAALIVACGSCTPTLTALVDT
eukprot:1416967-Pleurochrysis_carterae.AAC.2